jgi:putative membrane protein
MHALRRFTHAVAEVVKVDAGLFRRFPKLTLAALGILFVPAIYALIYLGSVWEPNARTTALPVGVVNDDAGVHYRDQDVNVGKEIVAALGKQPLFGYRRYADAEAARAAVRDGTLYFALLIPKDFSGNAVPGATQGGAKLVIYTSEGNNYAGAGFAKRFAPEIAHRVNEALNEKRWELVLATAAGSQQSLGQLKSGITELKNGADALNKGMADAHKGSADLEHGAAKLRDGAQQVNTGTAQLTDGVKQLGAGLRMMDAKKPAPADLQADRNA